MDYRRVSWFGGLVVFLFVSFGLCRPIRHHPAIWPISTPTTTLAGSSPGLTPLLLRMHRPTVAVEAILVSISFIHFGSWWSDWHSSFLSSATITTSGENSFVVSLVGGASAAIWLGGSLYNATTHQFGWATGPEKDTIFYQGLAGSSPTCFQAFCGWKTTEPSGDANSAVNMYSPAGNWNDEPQTNSITGYFVEVQYIP